MQVNKYSVNEETQCLAQVASRSTLLLHPPSPMGSVGEDYQCPHCGVTSQGGYAVDGINYPICTEGRANCLDKFLELGLATRAAVKGQAFRSIFLSHHGPNVMVTTMRLALTQIALFL